MSSKLMSDKIDKMEGISIDEEVKYEIHCCAKVNGHWGPITGTHDSVQEARRAIAKHKRSDRQDGIEFKYQIVKLIIKKEVVG